MLAAISSLKEQQPAGAAEPGSLWQYIHEDPTTAALYVSGVLCTPRLTMLWLHVFEYSTTLGPLLADEDEHNSQVSLPACASPHLRVHAINSLSHTTNVSTVSVLPGAYHCICIC